MDVNVADTMTCALAREVLATDVIGVGLGTPLALTASLAALRLHAEGATVLVDTVSLGFLAGSEIDFVEDMMGSSFSVKNPNATSSCGCGK